MKNLLFLLFAVSSLAVSQVEQIKPSLDAIEIMVKKQEWNQSLFYLGNVVDADRGKRWQSLLVRTATETVKAEAKTDLSAGLKAANDLLKKFPTLHSSPLFLRERESIILNGFEKCFTSGEKGSCSKRLLEVLEEEKKNTEFAVKASELLTQHGEVQDALTAFRLAMTDTSIPIVCRNQKLQLLIAAALSGTATDAAALATDIVDRYCWYYIKDLILKALNANPSKTFQSRACGILKKKRLGAERKKLCPR